MVEKVGSEDFQSLRTVDSVKNTITPLAKKAVVFVNEYVKQVQDSFNLHVNRFGKKTMVTDKYHAPKISQKSREIFGSAQHQKTLSPIGASRHQKVMNEIETTKGMKPSDIKRNPKGG